MHLHNQKPESGPLPSTHETVSEPKPRHKSQDKTKRLPDWQWHKNLLANSKNNPNVIQLQWITPSSRYVNANWNRKWPAATNQPTSSSDYNKINIQNDIKDELKISTRRSVVPPLYYVRERKTQKTTDSIILFMEMFTNEIGNKWQVIVKIPAERKFTFSQ